MGEEGGEARRSSRLPDDSAQHQNVPVLRHSMHLSSARAQLAEVSEGGGQGEGADGRASGGGVTEEDRGRGQMQVDGCAVGCCLRFLRPPDFSL